MAPRCGVMLIGLTFALVGGCLGGIVVSVRRAPAVALALAGALTAGIGAFAISSDDGPRGVPQDVAVWATIGLFAVGVVAVLASRGRPPSRALSRGALAVAATAPAAAAVFGTLLVAACPMYVTGRTYCHYDFDMLGGWSLGVAVLFLIDLFAIAAILWVSAVQARRAESATASEQPGR